MPERPAADERPDPTRAERLAALRRLDGICRRVLADNPVALAIATAVVEQHARTAPTPGDTPAGPEAPPRAE